MCFLPLTPDSFKGLGKNGKENVLKVGIAVVFGAFPYSNHYGAQYLFSLFYTLQRTVRPSPTEKELRKIIDSKGPANGREYVFSFPGG